MNGQSDQDNTAKRGSDRRRLVMAFLLGVAAAAVFFVLYFNVFRHGMTALGDKAEYYSELESRYGKFYHIEETVRKHSLYDVSEEDFDSRVAAAVMGIVTDAYAQYYTPEEYEAFERLYLDSYSGIGISVAIDEDGKVIITKVLEGGPAEEAGLMPGDIIAEIEGKVPESLEAASDSLRGEPGTKVEVLIERGGEQEEYTIYRREVEERSVSYTKLYEDDRIGYLRITSFRDGTADEFESAVKSLKSDGYSKIIIDLRGNVGGVTTDAIKIADMLLPACRIITVRNKAGEETVTNSDGSTIGIDYVLLIDGNSASASEIVAGAVKDNKGGLLIGSRSFGKGVIQTLYKFDDGSVIKITTDEYILPGGDSINGVGITPDIEIGEDGDALETARSELLKLYDRQ